MNWFKAFLIGVYFASIIVSILTIGKKRDPLSPGSVAFAVIVEIFIIFGLLFLI